jgi:hypothetical protein
VKISLTPLVVASLVLGASELGGQMMGGGRDVGAGREVMSERLANAAPGQRAWLEALREGPTGSRNVAQRVTLRAGLRTYSLGSADVSEALTQAAYSLRRPGLKLRVAGGPLRFTSGDSVAIAGVTPLDARLDLALGARDSLRIGVRAPSSPMTLSGAQVAALASLGTATVDLSSVELGTPAGVAVRYARSLPLGPSAGVLASIGVDWEPRPSSSRWSFWRGTTVRAGARATAAAGSALLSAGVEATRSFGDSLGGRNLFQGGGTLLARAGAATYLGGAEAAVVDVSAFYFRPFAAERTDAANRRIPSGDFFGAGAILVWPLGELLVTPTLVVSRESSHAGAGLAATAESGWAALSSLAVDVPLGSRFSLTPELGYARGSLRSAFASGAGGAGGTAFTESLSGWWLATDLSLSF